MLIGFLLIQRVFVDACLKKGFQTAFLVLFYGVRLGAVGRASLPAVWLFQNILFQTACYACLKAFTVGRAFVR
ncbi:hypothetical protein [Neisseria wadsworthii]|uniref:hypothetical protein n=1 Tax=Neisseria wadsworthii TaxID=607711 RepID=UPI00131BC375|nr:hypothetical protein [Neisseria wadsworthii]